MLWRKMAFGGVAALALGAFVAPAFAAEKPKPAPDATTKKDVDPVSSDPQLTTATFGDWVERCQRMTTGNETRRICEVALTVTASGQNAPLAEIALGRARKAEPLRLTLVLPVNVGFPSAPKLTLEDGESFEFVWRQCVPAGCFADTGPSAEQLGALRDAKGAKVESKAAGGQGFNFPISLRGLPQALDALAKEP